MFTKALADRLELTGITAHCLHPGIVRSNLWSHSSWLLRLLMAGALPFTRSSEQAAETITYLAALPKAAPANGQYFKNCRAVSASGKANNRAEIHRLWRISVEETGVGE